MTKHTCAKMRAAALSLLLTIASSAATHAAGVQRSSGLPVTPLIVNASENHSGHANHGAGKKDAKMQMGSASVGDLVIEAAWTRQTPPAAKVAGGYLTITNKGADTDRLIGGHADFAGRVEVHEMSVTDGVMRMAHLKDGLEIKPGETVELKPGGFHVMFMNISATPKEGETVLVRLIFEKAGDVAVEMPVAAIGASSGHGGDHSGMKHDMKKKHSE